MQVPLCKPSIGEEEERAVLDVLGSGWLAPGKYNKQFEKQFAEYIGTKYAVALNSGTSALHLAIQLNRITGDVLVPSFTFVASANAICTAGANPVFVDIDRDTRNMDPGKLEKKITQETQAIMPVHFAGQPCDMDKIMDIAQRYGLQIIEDSAETIGATHWGRMAGSFGTGCFSFFPTKNITSAEGGMLTTNDERLALVAKAYAGHGITRSTKEREEQKSWERDAEYRGYNFRMSNVHAAIGLEQLKKIEQLNAKRKRIAKRFNLGFGDLPGLEIPVVSEGNDHVYQMYTVLLPPSIDRENFIKKLNKKGIGANVHFCPPVHRQKAYAAHDSSDLEITDEVTKRIVTLPLYPSMNDEEISFLIDSVKNQFSSD